MKSPLMRVYTVFHKAVLISGQTTVQPWPIAVMRDPRIWPDAESFIPERWLGSYKGVEADRKDILAFSAGSRIVLGGSKSLVN